MANHGYGQLERDTTNNELYLLLDLCNQEHFKGLLRVEGAGSDYFVVYAGEERVFECWLEKPNQLEYRHGHATDVGWWVDGFMSSYIVNEIGGRIEDDGHGDTLVPDYFTRFPTYRSWIVHKSKYSSSTFRFLRCILDCDKRWIPKELWKHINRKVK